MKQIASVSLCFLLLISACSKKDNGIQDPFNPSVAKTIKNEAYGTLPFQKADIYLPAKRGAGTKTMVLIHGGFWSGGDKSDMDTLIGPIMAADPTLAIVNINYALADGTSATHHPAQMNDFKKLLDYIDGHTAEWHISNRYAFTGVSSGAHLAMVYAYAYDTEKRVKVIATVVGPTNFGDSVYTSSPLFQQLASDLLGKTWEQDSALYKSVSPVNLLKAGSPPTFMAYGESDPIVPLSNPFLLNEKLISFGIPHEFFLYPNESHELSAAAILNIIIHLKVFLNSYL